MTITLRRLTLVEAGKLAATVLIPEGYGDHLLNGQEVNLEVVANPNTLAGQTASTALETVVNRLLSATEVAQLSIDTFEQEAGFETEAAREHIESKPWPKQYPPGITASHGSSGTSNE